MSCALCCDQRWFPISLGNWSCCFFLFFFWERGMGLMWFDRLGRKIMNILWLYTNRPLFCTHPFHSPLPPSLKSTNRFKCNAIHLRHWDFRTAGLSFHKKWARFYNFTSPKLERLGNKREKWTQSNQNKTVIMESYILRFYTQHLCDNKGYIQI